MTDPKTPLPQAGGSYVREKDGTLRLEETPTEWAAGATDAPVEGVVETPLKGAFAAPVKRTTVKEV